MTASSPTHRLMLVGTALLFSTGGAAIKATALDGWQTAGLRSLVAGIALLILVPESRRHWNWRTLPIGLAYAATLILFVLANKSTTSANAIFLQSTAPAYLLVLAPLLLKERVHRADVMLAAGLAVGMSLFFAGAQAATATAPDPAHGNLLALASGLAWALTITGLRWQAHLVGEGSLASVAAGNLMAFLICAPRAFPLGNFQTSDILVVTYLGVFQIGLAYVLLTRGIRHVRAFEASAILLLEPVCNPLWALAIQGERPAAWAVAGGAVIVASTFLKIWTSRGEPVTRTP